MKTRITVPESLRDDIGNIVGLDDEGCVILTIGNSTAVLTRCCYATGKGSESFTGVVCRNCYVDVHHKHGRPHTSIAVARKDLDIVIEG
ncbi:hypothetical protein [Nocardia miyunensis]|uniref:hypothetical protein n=1 Tax=Nocardia miyunensis TaxID=282684 RepID=UPI00082AD13F|nr:hypothetical protein [Nocardia miyunensis]